MPGMRPRRVGILTGGGDCPGLNAVIRAFVKTADALCGWQVVGISHGFEGLLRPDGTQELTSDSVRGLLPRGGTILGTTNRGDPFHYKVLRDGCIEVVDRSSEALERLKQLQIDALVVVGGDGSLMTGLELQRRGMPIVGVPKTIDNDVSGTDVTFGFDTAVQTATDAIDKLHSTAESHDRVMILEVMGRNAGWIALESGLAGGGDVVLVPEIPFRVEKVAAHVKKRIKNGRSFSIVVAAEGAYPVGGSPIRISSGDPLAPTRLGGIGGWLAAELSAHVELEVRVTVLGHLQRGGSPSPFDRVLATRFGCAAALLVDEANYGKMVALRGTDIVPIALEDAVGTPKTIPMTSDKVVTARHLGMSFGD